MKPAAASQHDEKDKGDLRHELEGDAPASVLRPPVSGGAAAGIPAFLQRSLRAAAPARPSDATARSGASSPGARFVVGPRDDPLEHEAERVAATAASGAHAAPRPPARPPSSAISRANGGPPHAHAPVQRAPRADAAPAAAVEGAGAGSGEPLHSSVRQHAETALGAPLDHVRVHTGPGAQQLAGALGARAFTHGSHIWIGKGESADDLRLIAHEATHVVQQGRGAGGDARRIQRLPATATDDGEIVHGKLNAELEKAKRDAEKNGDKKKEPPPGKKPTIDPAERAQKKAELGPKAKPPRDRVGEARPRVERAAAETKAEAAKPPHEVKGHDKAVGDKAAKKAPPGATQAAAARRAYTAAAGVRAPTPLPPVVAPRHVRPVDAGGRPLPPDVRSEARVFALALAVQQMRMQATALRARAADERANAEIIRGNIQLAQSHIADSENSVTTVEGHVGYRRDVEGKARGALDVSEQKANKVANEAPGFVEKSSDGKDKSGPMASEASDLAGDAGNQKPDDDEAAGDSQEQAGQLSSTSNDLGSIDGAIGQTKTRAQGLEKDAALAKQKNAHSQKQIDTTDATLGKTDAKLAQMKAQNAGARAKLGGLAHGPAQHTAGADALDQQAIGLLDASRALEERLHRAQEKHEAGMSAVPASKARERRGAPGAAAPSQSRPVLVQRVAAGTPEKVDLDLAGRVTDYVPTWLTGEDRKTEEQRQQQIQSENKRRQDEIAEIEASANGDFSKLSATDKMGIALSLTGRHLWSGVAGTSWADFGGHLLRGFVDPRVSLMGIVSGLSMTLSGFGTIYKQWDRDPLGAVLTGAAQIANGVTIVLGSITGLALAIMVILTAIAIIGSIFSFGAVGAALAPIIAFCGTVVSTVGGWTIVAAEVALVLNALVFIKDLIDAATATTAENLQQNADAMTEDARNESSMALQIGMAKGAEFGAEVIGNTRFGQAMADQWGAVKEGAGLKPPPGGGAPPPGAPAADASAATGGSQPPAAASTTAGAPPSAPTVAEPVTPTVADVAPPPTPVAEPTAPAPAGGTTQPAPAAEATPPTPAAESNAPTATASPTAKAAPTEAPVKPTEAAPTPSANPGTAEPATPQPSKPAVEAPQTPHAPTPEAPTPPPPAAPKPAAPKPGVAEPVVGEPTAPTAQGAKPAPAAGKGTSGSGAKPAGAGEPAVDTPTQPLPEVKVQEPAEPTTAEGPSPEGSTTPAADQATGVATEPTEAPSEKPGDEAKTEDKPPAEGSKEAPKKKTDESRPARDSRKQGTPRPEVERPSPVEEPKAPVSEKPSVTDAEPRPAEGKPAVDQKVQDTAEGAGKPEEPTEQPTTEEVPPEKTPEELQRRDEELAAKRRANEAEIKRLDEQIKARQREADKLDQQARDLPSTNPERAKLLNKGQRELDAGNVRGAKEYYDRAMDLPEENPARTKLREKAARVRAARDLNAKRAALESENSAISKERLDIDKQLHPEKYPEPPQTTKEKGDIGEEKGHAKIDEDNDFLGSSKRPATGAKGQDQGLDGVYRRRQPKPGEKPYVVAEMKYGEAELSARQKTREWVDDNLDQAVGSAKAREIRVAGYDYVKVHYDPKTGTVTTTDIFTVAPAAAK